ncbi:MAG: hypothetical protein ACE15E_04450 [Acidobacteriota bacterium]
MSPNRLSAWWLLGFAVLILCWVDGAGGRAGEKHRVRSWEWKKLASPVIRPGFGGRYDGKVARAPYVVQIGEEYRMYYTGGDDTGKLSICMATAPVGKPQSWRPWPGNPVFTPAEGEAFDNRGVDFPNIVRLNDNLWYMYYTGWGTWAEKGRIANRTGLAISWDGGRTWTRDGPDPILPLGEAGKWDSDLTGSVFVLREGDRWRMWYTAGRYVSDSSAPQPIDIQIGLASSSDGIHWTRQPAPVLPTRKGDAPVYEYVTSKPNLLVEDGTYRLWYSHRGIGYRIGYAESKDGIAWTRSEDPGIDVSPDGWDSQIVEYAFVLPYRNGYRMWYTGNGFGATGIGFAQTQTAEP